MSALTALPPPPGGDVNLGPAVLAVSGVTFGLTWMTTIVRIAVRKTVVRQIGWDDYCIVLAMLLHIPSIVMTNLSVQAGLGRHIYYLLPEDAITALKWTQLDRILFILVTWLTKVSICLFLMRIPEDKRLIKLLWFVIGLFTLANAVWLVEFLTQCRPIQGLWDPTLTANCWSLTLEVDFGYMQGAFALLTDLFLSLLPIVFLWDLQIPIRQKLLICGLMATGLVATACCGVRIALSVVNEDVLDQTWVLVPETIWSICESDVAILAANLPPMFPIFRIAAKKLWSSYDDFMSWRSKRPSQASTEVASAQQSNYNKSAMEQSTFYEMPNPSDEAQTLRNKIEHDPTQYGSSKQANNHNNHTTPLPVSKFSNDFGHVPRSMV